MAVPAAVLMLFAARVAAQEPAFPRQMRIVAGSVGGTGPDFIARLVAPKLGEALHQSVIVENRPSANGIAAAAYVAKAPPDGSVTMLGNAGTHAINAALYKKLEYDPLIDWYALFAPARTPSPLVQAFYKEVTRIVRAPGVNERLLATGHRVVAGTHSSFPTG